MTIAHDLPPAAFAAETRWSAADDLPDLTDRRRVLLGFVFGLRVAAADADLVFATAPGAQRSPSSTTGTAGAAGPGPGTVER